MDADGREVHELEKNRGTTRSGRHSGSNYRSIEYMASFGRRGSIYVHTYEGEKRVEIAGEVYEIRYMDRNQTILHHMK